MIYMQFEITLKNEKIKSYRTIALIVLMLNVAVFLLMLFYDSYRYQAALAILLTGIYLGIRFYFLEKYHQGNFPDQALLFILAGCWVGLQNYYMVAAMVITGILYHLALQKITILFTPEKVITPGFPQKQYLWNVFNNVIIKDQLLTLDFKNNHLFQAVIKEPENLNEKEFNLFAQAQLNRGQMVETATIQPEKNQF